MLNFNNKRRIILEKITKPIIFTLKMLNSIDELAGKKNVSRSELVRLAVDKYLEKQERIENV